MKPQMGILFYLILKQADSTLNETWMIISHTVSLSIVYIQTGQPKSILFSITASLKLPYKNLSPLDNG